MENLNLDNIPQDIKSRLEAFLDADWKFMSEEVVDKVADEFIFLTAPYADVSNSINLYRAWHKRNSVRNQFES